MKRDNKWRTFFRLRDWILFILGLSPIPEVTEYFSRSSSHESLKGRETASQSYSHVTEGVVEVSINGSTRDGASDSLEKTKGRFHPT